MKSIITGLNFDGLLMSWNVCLMKSVDPGIDTTAAASIIAEIVTDMSKFPTAQHICSWAGLAPGNNKSAGKRKRTSVTKGNPYIKSMLREVAWVVAGKPNTYLS